MREFDLRIPVANWLLSRGLTPILECQSLNNCDMVGIEFENRKIKRMVAVELKLTDVAGVIRQCLSHVKWPMTEVWAAMLPVTDSGLAKIRAANIGLLLVAPPTCIVLNDSPVADRCDFDRWKNLYRRRNEYKWRMEHPQCLRNPALAMIRDRNELMESLL